MNKDSVLSIVHLFCTDDFDGIVKLCSQILQTCTEAVFVIVEGKIF